MPLLQEPGLWVAGALALIAGAAILLVVGRVRAPRRAAPARRQEPSRRVVRIDEGVARDRLLAQLVRDPETAVRATAELVAGAAPGPVAVRLLRSGVAPSVVARMCGVPERRLPDLVAGDRDPARPPAPPSPDGASPDGASPDQDRTDRNRTKEPGPTWARAGSPAASTTATTG